MRIGLLGLKTDAVCLRVSLGLRALRAENGEAFYGLYGSTVT